MRGRAGGLCKGRRRKTLKIGATHAAAPLPTLDEAGIMKVDELKRAKDQRPFQPFEIRMADGRLVTVRQPDTLAWDPEVPRTAIALAEGGGWEVIDIALITSLGIPAPKRPAEGSSTGDSGS